MYVKSKHSEYLYEVLTLRAKNGFGITQEELNNLIAASNLNNIVIFRSYVNEPIGYLIYAKVNSDTLRMMKMNNGKLLFPYEWKSGRYHFIVDVMISPPQKTLAKRQFVEFLKSKKAIAFYRKNTLSVRMMPSMIRKS